jgi:phytoene dehydrogenase-like protein
MTHQPSTVAVIGAGLAGLTAAATAATTGARVTVLDARAHIGGRARTASASGFLFNQGAHALYRGGAAWDVLTGFGITPRGHSPAATHADGLRADGSLAPLPGNARSMIRTRLVGPTAKFELARLLARPARLRSTVEPGTSLQEWIHARSRHADVRMVLALFARVSTYCGDLDALDADAGVAQMVQALTHGVVYLDDGWQQLVDGLQHVALTRGVAIHARAKADAIDVRADGVTVRTSGGDVDADAVVFAAGGPHDVHTLVPDRAPSLARWAAEEQPVVASALDLAFRALPVPTRRITFGLDEPMYFSVHTPYARLAPSGGEVAHLLWYGGEKDDPRSRLEWLLDCAQPGWRDHVVDERYGHRLVVAHGRPRPGHGLAGRPTVTVPDLPGVFVAGDWVGPDGLLADAVFASGRAAGDAAATNAPLRGALTTSRSAST